MIIATSRSPSL